MNPLLRKIGAGLALLSLGGPLYAGEVCHVPAHTQGDYTPVVSEHQDEVVVAPVAVPVVVPQFAFQYLPALAPVVSIPAPGSTAVPQVAGGVAGAAGTMGTTPTSPPAADGFPVGNYGDPASPHHPDTAQGLAVLANRCASCHTGPSAKGGAVIFSSPGVRGPADIADLYVQAKKGQMPPGKPLAPEEVASLKSLLSE